MKRIQLQNEIEAYKRLLVFMMEENVCLKNQLSEFLKYTSNYDILDEMELFQNNFLKIDDLFYLLRNEVAELEKLLKTIDEQNIVCSTHKKLNILRDNIKVVKHQFGEIQFEFNNYLSEKI